ncbi:hypothetical protein PGT21_018140 [Puccinia graminis f. sp. tritici]|uniref:Uncharacterized protein n=1 Tax=Puccinia graminis f. sp. tritici TaxID=56615 RepID=A0A5B0MNW0_PUCGR|nr:hypothetical protein PGT21_018140 [Puccinia graminis f. sp. tritici]
MTVASHDEVVAEELPYLIEPPSSPIQPGGTASGCLFTPVVTGCRTSRSPRTTYHPSLSISGLT